MVLVLRRDREKVVNGAFKEPNNRRQKKRRNNLPKKKKANHHPPSPPRPRDESPVRPCTWREIILSKIIYSFAIPSTFQVHSASSLSLIAMPKDPPKRRGRPPHVYKSSHTAPPVTIGHMGSTLTSMTTTTTSPPEIHTAQTTQIDAISHALTLHEAQIHNQSLPSDGIDEQRGEPTAGTAAAAAAAETTTTESLEPQIHITPTGTWVGLPLNPHRAAERQALWDLIASCDYIVGTPADAKADLNLEALNGLQSAKLDATMNNGFVKPTRQKKIEGPDYFSQVINVEDIPRFFDGLVRSSDYLWRGCNFLTFY